MKIKLFLLAFLFLSIPQAQAQCANSTCITGAMIDLAETRNITWDRVDTHYQYLDPSAACSGGMIRSAVTTYKWYADGRNGMWLNAQDYFCVIPGCNFQQDINTTTTPGTGGTPPTTTTQITNLRCE